MSGGESAPGYQPPSVLVIDDEDYVADMIATSLDLEGYTVQVAYNGRDGLECAKDRVFQLIIVDIMMPYLSGEMMVQELRLIDQSYDVPVILISAGARPQRLDANVTFVPKPFEIEAMLALVKEKIGNPARGAP